MLHPFGSLTTVTVNWAPAGKGIPTLGGRNMLIAVGSRDQCPMQALPNYGLSYRSAVLDQDLTIAGSVDVTLHVESNCRDTDFVAKLIEQHPDRRAMLLMDGVVRAMYRDPAAGPQHLAPDQVYPLTIHLGDIHHTFTAGSCLQVDITSSNFPRRVRNTNSGNPILADDTAADIQIATNAVHHRKGQPSFLVLPVLPVSTKRIDSRQLWFERVVGTGMDSGGKAPRQPNK